LAVNKRKILESAQKHLQKGALDRALEDYQTLLKADGKDSNIRLKVGDLQLKLGRTQEAIDAYLRVAQQFTHEGFDAKAVALYKQITRLDDKRFDVHAQLGDLYHRMGLTSEGLKALQQAADGAYRVGDKPQALTLLRRMAALDPSNTPSRLKVADLLRKEGQAAEALAEYEEVANELERQRNSEEQLRVLERMLELDANRTETLRALARVGVAGSMWEKAESAARRLLNLNEEDLEAAEWLGQALEGRGRSDEAAEVFRALAERYRARGDEDRSRALVQRYGVTSEISVDDSESMLLESEEEPEFNEGLSSDPDSGVTLSGENGEDTDWLEAPAAEEPEPEPERRAPTEERAEDAEQLLAEAGVFLRYGKHDRAIETLRAALRIDPGNPGALEKLGDALAVSGNKAHAASALQRAAEAYRAASDDASLERVRARLEKLDPKAAAALLAPARATPPPAPEPEPEPLALEPDAADFDPGEIDVDLDVDPSDEPAPDANAETSAAPADVSARDLDGIEIDVGDLGDVGAEDPAPEEPASEPALAFEQDSDAFSFQEEEEPAATPAEPARPPEKSSSATTPARVTADLEEADFYLQQGMRDEARALYQRVLAAVPNHPKALLRMGELEASEPAPVPAPTPAPVAKAAAAPNAPAPLAAKPAPPQVAAAKSEPDAFELDFDDDSSDAPAIVPEPPSPPAVTHVEADLTAPSLPPVSASELGDFDLAAELSGALGETEGRSSGRGTETEAFEEVFAAFKAGVAREVDDGDHEAHYDLGIAYKEMGLFEDAIGEFRSALDSPQRRISCLHLMALCALELGRGNDAVAHLEQALAGATLPAEQEIALRLDLGRAYATSGDTQRARAAYEAVRAHDPTFGDVERLLAELEEAPAREAAAEEAPGALESFDDLIESEGEPAAEAPAAEQYESFDDLMDDAGEDEAPPRAPARAPEPTRSAAPAAHTRAPASAPKRAKPEQKSEAEETAPAKPAAAARRKKKISFV
jgi:tetratricopeptide (TPR) repeat protein